MGPVTDVVTVLLGVLLAVSVYQGAITVLGSVIRRPAARPRDDLRFGLVICARNERGVIGATVGALLGQAYPRERFRVVVVAHNCTDDTAAVAAAAGAEVIEAASDAAGKAHAIAPAVRRLGGEADFIGVFDADSRVPPDLLATVAAAAGNDVCLQVATVPHAGTTAVAEAYGFSRRARNLFWWRPREALRLGVTVSGTGWFIRPGVLSETLEGWHTLTEDLEVTARLYAHGHRVRFVSATAVEVEEPAHLSQSLGQRTRWVRGHLGVVAHEGPRLGLRVLRGDVRAFDLLVCMLAPSHVITRTAAVAAVATVAVAPAWAPPLGLVVAGAAAELLVPVPVAWRGGLLGGRESLALGARSTALSLLWFPIGLWGLATAARTTWHPAQRASGREEGEAGLVAVAEATSDAGSS